MKKIPLIIALALSLIGCAKQDSTVLSDPDSEYELSYSDTDIVLSQKDALGFVEEEFMNMNTDIWVSKNIVPASTVIHCLYSEIPAPKYDSWLVFYQS